MAILFLDFFGSDPSKMDQTHKFGEQTPGFLVIYKGTYLLVNLESFVHFYRDPWRPRTSVEKDIGLQDYLLSWVAGAK